MASSEVVLQPHPASVGRARKWISERLEEWDLEELDHDMSVVVSELVTNAVLHAHTDIRLRLANEPSNIRLEVCDESPLLPLTRVHARGATTGRGLQLVAALSSSWGYEALPTGKRVWAEFVLGDSKEAAQDVVGEETRSASITPIRRPAHGRGPALSQRQSR